MTQAKSLINNDRIRPNIVISDEVGGFADPDFWGEFNVIASEKPIEAAIRKIKKQLEKIIPHKILAQSFVNSK